MSMSEILGEEADIAQCEFCGKQNDIDKGIICEGCQGWYDRRECLWNHNCGKLFDRHGQIVNVGDVLKYPENKDIFTVVEALPSYVRVGACRAERRRGKEIIPIITKFTEHV